MDVIPMIVREENAGVDRAGILAEAFPQGADARTGVEDENAIFNSHFQAGRVAAELDGGGPGGGE